MTVAAVVALLLLFLLGIALMRAAHIVEKARADRDAMNAQRVVDQLAGKDVARRAMEWRRHE